ncbi:MAG: response regulator [Myxococcota bacterium]|nr:response regulator [Myxococcota bacterium]
MRFLLVEDDPSHAALMRGQLKRMKAEVLHVETVSQAIHALTGDAGFDLVLLDQRLPDGRGFEVHDWLRARGLVLPVIFVTAESETDQVIRASRDGAQGYVVKRPGYLVQLEAEIARALHGEREVRASTRAQFEEAERRKLTAALARHEWNVSATARALGIGRGKLRSRMRALDIEG